MEIALLGVIGAAVVTLVVLTIVYYLIRFAVRDGVVDATRKVDADRVRAELGVGPECGPSSR